MLFEGFPKLSRLSRNCIITEKIDGTNAQIFIEDVKKEAEKDGSSYDMIRYGDSNILFHSDDWTIRAGSRTKFITSKDDNFGFAKWVQDNAIELCKLGAGRHFGEWWGSGIQRGYGLPKGERRFSLFNTTRWEGNSDLPKCCNIVPVLYKGMFDTNKINNTLAWLGFFGSYASPGFMNPEGIVIYHTAQNACFKKTIKNDEKRKSEI